MKTRIAVMGAVGWLLVGCATARMGAPNDVTESSEVLTVSDRSSASGAFVDESFKLGTYNVADVDRDWNSSSGVGVGPWGKETKTTGFAFNLKGGAKALAGKCASETREQSVLGLGGEFSWGNTTVACACEGDGDKAELLMSKKQNTVTIDGTTYELAPVHSTTEGDDASEPTGFRADGDELLGAVEVMHPGQVWLNKALDDGAKSKAACLFAGLMLYKPPSDY